MADVHSKAVRSYNMSKIRSKNTVPEMLVRRYLHGKGFRYRLHVIGLPGKPDIVLPKYKIVIFIHGCFWHGHKNCKYYVIPKTNTEWWLNKINRNITNDSTKRTELEKDNWHVIDIWECALKKNTHTETLEKLKKDIQAKNGNSYHRSIRRTRGIR